MSLDVLTAIWRDPPCKGGDLLCLLAIADNADENGYAWPSISTIARKAAMGERGAQKCIKKLAEMGLILVNSGGGRNKTNAYQITTNGIGGQHQHKNPEQNTPPPSSPFTDENPEQRDINPEPAFAKPRTPVHPNSQELSKEPPYRKKPAQSRQTQIPPDAVASEAMLRAADKRDLTRQEAESQFEAFKCRAIAKGLTYANWDMAFVTWLDSPYFTLRTGGSNARPHTKNVSQFPSGSAQAGKRTDPALEKALRLSGLGEA